MKKITVFILLCCMLCGVAFADFDNDISSLVCGDDCVFVVMDDGKLIAWGDNSAGLIPNESHSKNIRYEARCLIMSNAKSVAIGEKCALAINSGKELYGWGNEDKASLLCGKAYGGYAEEPVKLMDNVAYASCGKDHNAAVTADGVLYTWGKDTCGSLGLGEINGTVIRQPNEVMDNVSAVYCFENDTLAIGSDGLLYAWGESFGNCLPKVIAARIVDVAKACNGNYLLLNSSGNVLLLKCNLDKDGVPVIELSPSISSNVTAITNYGYVRDDGVLWMCKDRSSNTFIPSAEKVRIVNCCDMSYRSYVSLRTLHLEDYEMKSFIEDESHHISDIDLSIQPASSGIIIALIFAALIAVGAIIVVEKPSFYIKLKEKILAQF